MSITKFEANQTIEKLMDDIAQLLEHHYSIRSDDPQYDSPDMWWAEDMLMDLRTVKLNQKL